MDENHLMIIDRLDQLEELLLEGGRIPFSSNRLVNEQESIELLDTIRESLPKEVIKAKEIVQKGEIYIKDSQNISEQIINKARKEREQMIDSRGVRKEAERQISELKNYARQQSEKLLQEARQQVMRIEHEMQIKISKLETSYSKRKQELEAELSKRKQALEQENASLQKSYKHQFEIKNNKALIELENCHQEGLVIKRDSQEEANRIHKEALIHRQTTQQHCESLINKARQDALQLQDGANQYAERTLAELEDKLYKLTQIVVSGRNELGKIESISTPNNNITNINSSQKTNMSFRNLRDHASKIRNTIKNRA